MTKDVRGTLFSRRLGLASALGLVSVASAQVQQIAPKPMYYIVPLRSEISTLYVDGSEIEIQGEQRWHWMCNTDLRQVTQDQLIAVANANIAEFENPPTVIVDSGNRGSAINIIYNADASVPANALTALGLCETYLEGLFGDPINVSVNVSFANLGAGVIGATGSNYVNAVTWNNTRNGLQNDMDPDDTIQDWLPSGSTIPVRFNGNNSTVTNVNSVNFTRANYRACVGTVSGSAASMTFNSTFNFDFDPSNGVGSRTSFVDVAVHETGHSLGFTSAADGSGTQIEALDIYRFQRTDGTGDFNPDTLAEFQTTARLVDFNTPNDDHNSDVIDNSYRMSDGDPYQASHFREQGGASWIGLMDPALAGGETHFPNYFSSADLTMFDAMGYDYPPCPIVFTQHPNPSQAVCAGDTVQLSVVTSSPSPSYQWRIGTTNVVNGGNISGATTATLTISNIGIGNAASDYNCVITSGSCSRPSNNADVQVANDAPNFNQQPQNQNVPQGGLISLDVSVTSPFSYLYQWRKGGVDLVDDARIIGAQSANLTIEPAQAGDAGDYDCLITSVFSTCDGLSNTATVTISAPCSVNFTQQPNPSQTVCEGAPVSLTVATNSPSPTYQWRRGTTNINNGGTISGATSATLMISAVAAGDAGSNYNCLITSNGACSAASNNATINVGIYPPFTAQPMDDTLFEGDAIMLSVAVINPGDYTYQWRRNTSNLNNDVRITGATTANLMISPAQIGDTGSYDCVVTSTLGGCSDTSDAANVTVNAVPDCPGDLDGDHAVTIADVGILLANFGSTNATPEQGDLSGDGNIDLTDLSEILALFGTTCM